MYVVFYFLAFRCQYHAVDCLEILVSEMTYYVSSETLNLLTHLMYHSVL